MNEEFSALLRRFRLQGTAVSCERYGQGHINQTYLVVTDAGARYILQRINEHVFPDVDGLMENIVRVTAFLRERSDDPRAAMRVVPAEDGGSWLRTQGGCFRM